MMLSDQPDPETRITADTTLFGGRSADIDRPDTPPVTAHQLREFKPDFIALVALGVLTFVSNFLIYRNAVDEPYVVFVWSQALEQVGGGGSAVAGWCAFALGIGRAVAQGCLSRGWLWALLWAAPFMAYQTFAAVGYIEDRYAFAAWPS